MRYLSLILLLSCSIAACKPSVKGANGVSYKNAIEYNDYIISRQTAIIKNVMEFLKVSETNLDSARNLLDKYAAELDTVIVDIKGMPAYKGDSALRDAAVNSFSFYRRIFADQYKQLIDIRKSGAAETEEGAAEMNRIVEGITREEESFDKTFHNAQKDFAEKNKMRLTENDMQKTIDKMDK